mmetsp:Transcript_7724/g.15848  ORF Transcript_7724/g.15848 Transcript_7724/m.15848 type:complete len:326 (-) Transcript_7724:164-1141(-)
MGGMQASPPPFPAVVDNAVEDPLDSSGGGGGTSGDDALANASTSPQSSSSLLSVEVLARAFTEPSSSPSLPPSSSSPSSSASTTSLATERQSPPALVPSSGYLSPSRRGSGKGTATPSASGSSSNSRSGSPCFSADGGGAEGWAERERLLAGDDDGSSLLAENSVSEYFENNPDTCPSDLNIEMLRVADALPLNRTLPTTAVDLERFLEAAIEAAHSMPCSSASPTLPFGSCSFDGGSSGTGLAPQEEGRETANPDSGAAEPKRAAASSLSTQEEADSNGEDTDNRGVSWVKRMVPESAAGKGAALSAAVTGLFMAVQFFRKRSS